MLKQLTVNHGLAMYLVSDHETVYWRRGALRDTVIATGKDGNGYYKNAIKTNQSGNLQPSP